MFRMLLLCLAGLSSVLVTQVTHSETPWAADIRAAQQCISDSADWDAALSCLGKMEEYSVSEIQPLETQWERDMYSAQNCFNKSRDRNTVLRCLRRIERYTDSDASLLKCAIRADYQGFDFLNFPWFLSQSDEYLWFTVANAISDRDLDVNDAEVIHLDCSRGANVKDPPLVMVSIVGDYYLLRGLLLSIGDIRLPQMELALPAVQSVSVKNRIGELANSIYWHCASLKESALLRRSSYCIEALNLYTYTGDTAYEKFLNGLARAP